MRIILNRCKCLKCGDIITSRHVHDFVMCKCGAVFTDGGNEYCRRGGEPGDIEDMSEYEEKPIIPLEKQVASLVNLANMVADKEQKQDEHALELFLLGLYTRNANKDK